MGGQGIDLADLGSGNPVHLMPEDPPVAHPPNEAPSKREKFVELTKTSATKMKELKPSLKTAPIVSPDQTILGGLDHDPAFKTNSLHEEIRGNEKEKRVEPLKILKSIGKGIIQPKQTFKKQATEVTAGKLSTVERSFISHKADLELVHAHDELGHVEKKISSNTSTPGSTVEGHSYDECRSRVEGLEQQRESLRAAWITNHQVFRVRVVPSRPYQAPETKDVFGDPGDGRWLEKVLQFLGRVSNDPRASKSNNCNLAACPTFLMGHEVMVHETVHLFIVSTSKCDAGSALLPSRRLHNVCGRNRRTAFRRCIVTE